MIRLALLLICLFTSTSHAEASLQFSSKEQSETYQQVINQLRCPKCQNQTIADSNAPIAIDLKQKVYDLAEEGKDQEAIMIYMVERYGHFVNYKPPVNPVTWLLWFGPVLFLLAVVFYFIFFILRRQT